MKKFMKILCASAAVFALALTTTFAAPSQTANGVVVGETTVDGKKFDGKVVFESTFVDVPKEKEAQIANVNTGKDLLTALEGEKVTLPANVTLKDLNALTKVQDLVLRDAEGNVVKGKNVKITWEVPNLTADLGTVYVLHFSTVRNVWEVITPDAVDLKAKTVTATFPDLSPVAVVYTPAANGTTGNGGKDSVKTSDNTNIALYAGVGVVALAAIGLVTLKLRKEN